MAQFVRIFDDPDFDWVTRYRVGPRMHFVQRPFGDVDAEVYIAFARADLAEQGTQRGLVNAFSNAKRSIHYQVERVYWHLGFVADAIPASFPARVNQLTEYGFIPGELLIAYNHQRNQIEHDYICPDRASCTHVVELAQLLNLALTPLIRSIVSSMSVELASGGTVLLQLCPGSDKIVLDGEPLPLHRSNRSQWERYVRLAAFSAGSPDTDL